MARLPAPTVPPTMPPRVGMTGLVKLAGSENFSGEGYVNRVPGRSTLRQRWIDNLMFVIACLLIGAAAFVVLVWLRH